MTHILIHLYKKNAVLFVMKKYSFFLKILMCFFVCVFFFTFPVNYIHFPVDFKFHFLKLKIHAFKGEFDSLHPALLWPFIGKRIYKILNLESRKLLQNRSNRLFLVQLSFILTGWLQIYFSVREFLLHSPL